MSEVEQLRARIKELEEEVAFMKKIIDANVWVLEILEKSFKEETK